MKRGLTLTKTPVIKPKKVKLKVTPTAFVQEELQWKVLQSQERTQEELIDFAGSTTANRNIKRIGKV